jgi:hypothetical protein
VKRAAGAMIVITCAGCGWWRRPDPRPAVVYTCRVPQPPPPAIPTFDMPAGRLELQLLEAPAAPTSPDGGSPLDGSPIAGRRLRVVAEAVPLSTFTVALAERLGVGVVLDPALVKLRVSFSLPDITVDRLLRLVLDDYDVVSSFHDGIIHLDTPFGARRRYDPQPLEVRIIPVPKNIPPAQAADAACAFALSDSGSASAAGQNLVVRDGPEHLLKVEALMRALAARANGSRPPEAADPPAQAE